MRCNLLVSKNDVKLEKPHSESNIELNCAGSLSNPFPNFCPNDINDIPNRTIPVRDVAYLDVRSYNVPKGEGINQLGQIGYSTEEFFSDSGQPNVPQNVFWVETSQHWRHLAADLEGMELERCLNSSLCLPGKAKVVVGLRASTANIFVDNAAYRDYLLFKTFGVSSVEMESVAVVMASN
ncbi:Nucleoside phosphorylase domain [Macleaya cordata]|uniref:Nucleoside phosphorylase domain n=1 Tax=Macleaya cordata TaxID=56857 RepID=A0A200R582_MACCD|nr:Nucleoside phosphorylase domain [Macleaya cordata]